MARILSAVVLIVVVQACLSVPDQYKRMYRDLPIRYPGPVKPVDDDRYEQPGKVDVPDECRNLTYCTVKPNDYPDQEIKQLFKYKKVQVPPPELELDLIIGNRQGDPNEEDNCPSVVSYEPIYKLKNDNKWQTVVQAPELAYEQKVRMERCMEPQGKSCFTVGTFPSNIRTKCLQKFATWKLQVLDDNRKPVMKEVDLPSCCSCHYEVINA